MDISQIDVLGFFLQILSVILQPIVDFLLGFLPDGDPEVYAVIDGISTIGSDMSFNVFYFCDWSAVLLCFGVMVAVMLVVTVVKYMLRSMDIAAKAIEAVPVVE